MLPYENPGAVPSNVIAQSSAGGSAIASAKAVSAWPDSSEGASSL
jgi:hypothetical protein